MNETNKNQVNVNELMQKIREEVASRNSLLSPTVPSSFSQASEIDLVANYIEDLLTNAESRSHVRTKWPDKLNRFPLNLTGGLRKIVLKAINFLFKDQREVNFALIQACGELVKLNRHATKQVSDLNGQVSDLNGQVSDLNSRIQDIDTRTLTNDVYIKNDLVQQKRLITMFLEEAKKRLPEPFTREELQNFVNQEQHALDAFYVAFEDQFRGSREDIYERLKVYIPVLEAANLDREAQILDIGCGRGEWLELLHSFGYNKAKGIDINRVMLEQCQARGLEVSESDVVGYLQSLPDESLGAVTGFHIIEHLPFESLIKVFDETRRVLKSGGIAIFETPNPENVLVGSNTFYTDPTHRNPLPSSMIKFMAESRGLDKVIIMELHPHPEHLNISGSELTERFNKHFYGSQDYAMVGYKV